MSYNQQNSINKLFINLPFIVKWLAISIVSSGLIGSASAGFLFALEWATNTREAHPILLYFLPIVGFLIGCIYHYYGKTVEAGNNLLIETIHQPKGIIPWIMAPFVFGGTIMTHLFGGSAGREGTALQMAGSIADQLSKPFRLSAEDRKILIVAAVAGGFGSIFGTPLAGVVFGLEFYMIGRLRYNALLPAVFTAILSDYVTKLWNAHHTHYIVGEIPEIHPELIGYVVLAAILFGFCARLFSVMMKKLSSIFKSKITYAPLRPFVGGLMVLLGIALVGSTKYIGLGIPMIEASFLSPSAPYDFIIKLLFTVVTLTAGYKGGEVTPLFFIGATLGSALSVIFQVPTGLFAGIGFVAVFAGATNTPIACTLMAIELFGPQIGVYAAIACVVSYFISGHTSIYTKQMVCEPKHSTLIEDKGKNLTEL